ncbi:MAG: FAD-binding domain-containing protein [Chitinophagaceae bacterium]
MQFPTDYQNILSRIDHINPSEYGITRNYTNGDISYLSPYISRGVISTKQVVDTLLTKGYDFSASIKFIQQLAWREYFQRAWQFLEDDMFDDIRHRYTGIRHKKMPIALTTASTGIESVDNAIRELYETGYMHNHLRMYTASIACNISKADWLVPSEWMYYHLLDGDLASNTCSWQWIAGNFSSKQYFCNQENINKYTGSKQRHTFLDKAYDELPAMDIPGILSSTTSLQLTTSLPDSKITGVEPSLPLLLYTSYNLDPEWRKDMKANRILLLEPSHFRQHPVSEKVVAFILELAKNIEGLQIFVGEVNKIPGINQFPSIYSKEHPAFKHLPGIKDERDWIFPEVNGFYNSFFSFWKKCEQTLKVKGKIKAELLRA